MQTGATLSLYFDQKVSASYTGYLDNTKKNRLFKDALISITERIYRADYGQKEWDEITFLTRTEIPFIPSQNTFSTASLKVSGVLVASATTFTITTLLPHQLTTGQSVTISGITGTLTMSSANGTFIATVNSTTTFTITVGSATGVYTANTGVVVTPSTISDYWHLLAIKTLFNTPIYNLTITGATNRPLILLTLSARNIIRTGSKIMIAGVIGNTAANGIRYAQVKNDFTIGLYSDINLQTPVAGNGLYVSGGTISMVNDNYASPYISTAKQGILNKPTAQDPSYEIANNQIKIYPLTETCSSAVLDYIRIPPVVIDVADSVIDLTLYYPEKFLFSIVNEAQTLFANETRDIELLQTASQELQKNP